MANSRYVASELNTDSARTEQTNKVIRNTYMLLSLTMVLSTITAGISTMLYMPPMTYLIGIVVGFVLLFVINKKQNSAAALPLTFLFTGIMGFSLGPLLNVYLNMANGTQIVMTALGMTAITFFGLTAYVMTTKKDFSFMGGFLAAGSMVLLVAMAALFILPWFGVDISAMSLAFSALVVVLMCGFLLYDTSLIINGTYTNYIMATIALYLNIYNLFVHLLNLIGAFSGDD